MLHTVNENAEDKKITAYFCCDCFLKFTLTICVITEFYMFEKIFKEVKEINKKVSLTEILFLEFFLMVKWSIQPNIRI